jgi:RNA polymerase sigma-70 factor, ECF subfamily
VDAVADEKLTIPAQLRQALPARAQPASLEVVYVRHYRAVYGYLLAMTRSHDEAEDLVGETFERALRAWESRPPAKGMELAWLLLTARRLATDRWRHARRYAALARSNGPLGSAGGHAGEGATEFWMWFDALSEVLSERQREVLLLRYQRDLSDEDIALIMGISPSGVRSAVSRALAALRRHPELL